MTQESESDRPGHAGLVNALSMMRSTNITQLLVVKKGKYLGVIHLHDILKEGII